MNSIRVDIEHLNQQHFIHRRVTLLWAHGEVSSCFSVTTKSTSIVAMSKWHISSTFLPHAPLISCYFLLGVVLEYLILLVLHSLPLVERLNNTLLVAPHLLIQTVSTRWRTLTESKDRFHNREFCSSCIHARDGHPIVHNHAGAND